MITPEGVKRFTGKLPAGWSHVITPGTGIAEITAYGPPRGDGSRPKVSATAPCSSVGVRMRHEDGERCAAAVWLKREDRTPAGKARPWLYDCGFIWLADDFPRQLGTQAELVAMLALPSADAVRAAVKALRLAALVEFEKTAKEKAA